MLKYYTTEIRDFELKELFFVMNLLNQVNEKVCPVEVILDKGEEEIWKNDMLPQTRVIKKNTGKTAVDWIKNNPGIDGMTKSLFFRNQVSFL